MATRSLPRNNPSFHIAGVAVTLALMRARQAVKDALRRKGEKVSSFPAREITTMAKAYLAEHRELMVEAKATVERWMLEGVFGKRAQRVPGLRLRVFAKLRDYEHWPSRKLQNAARIADERHCADYCKSNTATPPAQRGLSATGILN